MNSELTGENFHSFRREVGVKDVAELVLTCCLENSGSLQARISDSCTHPVDCHSHFIKGQVRGGPR